jgi:cytochrome d ubiquinol oxidase subunit II
MTWLPVVWAGLIAFAVLAYVLLDGFDLGVGILFAAERREEDRDVMVNTVAPVWDGNETWLVFGGGGLFAVFPLAYAVIMPALYPAIIAMLLSLVFRGVGFEFRFRAATERGRIWWDRALCAGSTLAAFCQGLVLGGLLQGIRVQDRAYAGGWWDWLTPFTVLCGVALVIGYALQGACWLVWRCEGALQQRARRQARTLAVATLVLIVVVSIWTPLLHPTFSQRWFTWPNVALTSPVPILVALVGWLFWRGLERGHHATPLLCADAWFVLCYAGLGISLWPDIVPPDITIWDAAAPPASQRFLLIGALILVPIILIYTGFAYWVFRGKVRPGMHTY